MLNGPWGKPWAARGNETFGESKDGQGASDCDKPYHFGSHVTTWNTYPFTPRQFARLQCVRSHVQDGDRVPEVWVLEHPERFGLREPSPVEQPACFDDNCWKCRAYLEWVEA